MDGLERNGTEEQIFVSDILQFPLPASVRPSVCLGPSILNLAYILSA